MFKLSTVNAEVCDEKFMSTINDNTGESNSAHISVRDGVVRIYGNEGEKAKLSWDDPRIKVKVFGERIDDVQEVVAEVGTRIDISVLSEPSTIDYDVSISRDRMEAMLCVRINLGAECYFADADCVGNVVLRVLERDGAEPIPDRSEALKAIQYSGIVHGLDYSALDQALDSKNSSTVIAKGTAPTEGRDGYLEYLCDFKMLETKGVLKGTPLVRRVRRREGEDGLDVTGKTIQVAKTTDVNLMAGEGVYIDDQKILATADVDGAPSISDKGVVSVAHELVLDSVCTATGDIEFQGSVLIRGNIQEGRRLSARDQVHVEGNVDRAVVNAGSHMTIEGSVMSSTLRAGGERALAASIADKVFEIPRQLGVIIAQARQLRDQAQSRGSEVSFGLSVQLVLERIHKQLLPMLLSIVKDLEESDEESSFSSSTVLSWHQQLSTAATRSLTPEQLQKILVEVGVLSDDVMRALEYAADLKVNYVQTSQIEATGAIDLYGKGIFNSRVVAWGGLNALHGEAVLRGGVIQSRGDIKVHEIGAPSGATTEVQLGREASVKADHVCAGTLIYGPGSTHRFVTDRSDVHIVFDSGGAMSVDSFAA